MILLFELKEKKLLKAKLEELNMNLENNYKDLAHSALKEYCELLEALKEQGLKEKTYLRYKKIGDEYIKKMADYHH